MGTKWKKFSHSKITKIIVFLAAIICFAGAITTFLNVYVEQRENLDILFERDYFQGRKFISYCSDTVNNLNQIVQVYKSEENILAGNSLREGRLKYEEERLFQDFESNSKSYNPNLSREENYQIFKEVYADRLVLNRERLIQEELRHYNETRRSLEEHPGLIYYAKMGETQISNSPVMTKEYFRTFPSYIIMSGTDRKIEVYPRGIEENPRYYWLDSLMFDAPHDKEAGPADIICLAFTPEFINSEISNWRNSKLLATKGLQQTGFFLSGLAAAFIWLVLVAGRKPGEDRGIELNALDRLYNDFKVILCGVLIVLWFAIMAALHHLKSYGLVFPVTLLIAACGLILVLSLVKHAKNKTLLRHTLISCILLKIWGFVRDIYDSGSVAVKAVVIVIGYPLLAAATFFMFPVTIGAAAWLVLKKVKEFNAIKEGVKRVKEGELRYTIKIQGKGELAALAEDINTITEGLNKAVENEIKSERLKTELITNVSHDIRTPLTSIITYVDLLKQEKDPVKAGEYLEVLEQKSQRLKILTDDLFEAAKASSGNIPVHPEKIDLVSLITQGLGELDDKIREHRLDFKISHPRDKMYIKADGKLIWRAIENLLSNIFKYALEGSRVYVEIADAGTAVRLTLKNISAYELNISAAELMERFKRGDESRSSQGSGLGLSIAKSLIEAQQGSFDIEIDGDLFKAVIKMPQDS